MKLWGGLKEAFSCCSCIDPPPPLPFLHTELSIPRIFYVQPVISKLPSGTVQIIFYIINPDTQKSTSCNALAHKEEEEEEASCESNVN